MIARRGGLRSAGRGRGRSVSTGCFYELLLTEPRTTTGGDERQTGGGCQHTLEAVEIAARAAGADGFNHQATVGDLLFDFVQPLGRQQQGKVLGQIKLPEVAANLGWADDGHTLYITASTSIYRLTVASPGQMPLYVK